MRQKAGLAYTMGQEGWRASAISTPFELAARARADNCGMASNSIGFPISERQTKAGDENDYTAGAAPCARAYDSSVARRAIRAAP